MFDGMPLLLTFDNLCLKCLTCVRAAMPNGNCLLRQKVCHYLDQDSIGVTSQASLVLCWWN